VEVAWLGEPETHDPALVGGKAASLSRLAAEHRVPPGFAVTSHALGLAAPDLARGTVPGPLRRQIDEAYRRLGCGKVAVRSSAIDEDGDAHSFAGQHETFLNVEGLDPIAEAVVLCFASAFTARALDYRLHVGLPVDHIGLAILIQAQIAADSAAVVFSANPVNGRLDEVVINASYGLGESIVGGTTTPDTFVVRKDDLEIVSRMIGEKRVMTVPVPGGTRELETPALLRDLPSVTDTQIEELAELAIRLENGGGTPVDIECAVLDDAVYLLQSRPITTLRTGFAAERGAS
jgi:pyruvate,water dikinase